MRYASVIKVPLTGWKHPASISGMNMHPAFTRLWTVLKATLAIGFLAGGSLYSANVLDKQGLNLFAAALAEPMTTGSVRTSRVE